MKEESKIKKIKFSNFTILNGSIMPIVYMAILICLFFVFIKVGLDKYITQQKLLREFRVQQNILSQKVNYLTENQSVIKQNTGLVSVALPEKNPALLLIANIKSFQSQVPLLISNIKVTSPSKLGQTKYSLGISFTVEGDIAGIMDLIGKLNNILPITLINRIMISGEGGAYLADIRITTFWENLPQKIPSVTDPIKLMSKDSITLLTKLQGMARPEFTNMSPQSPTTRTNPF